MLEQATELEERLRLERLRVAQEIAATLLEDILDSVDTRINRERESRELREKLNASLKMFKTLNLVCICVYVVYRMDWCVYGGGDMRA